MIAQQQEVEAVAALDQKTGRKSFVL